MSELYDSSDSDELTSSYILCFRPVEISDCIKAKINVKGCVIYAKLGVLNKMLLTFLVSLMLVTKHLTISGPFHHDLHPICLQDTVTVNVTWSH